MTVVFLDTNVLLHADRFRKNIEDSVVQLVPQIEEILIHPYVEAEVISMLTGSGKLSNQANFAMKLLSRFAPYLDPREYSGTDTALMVSAKRENAIVFTIDKQLKKRCMDQGIAVISTYRKGILRLFGNYFQ